MRCARPSAASKKPSRADPHYALAYAGLSDAYMTLGTTIAMPPAEAFSRAKLFAQQGLTLDDTVAELHGSLGQALRFYEWDWPGAEREYLRALELNPGVGDSHRSYALLLATLGRPDEAIANAKRALEEDPLSLIIYTVVGDTLFYARRYEESISYYSRCHEMDPSFGPATPTSPLARARGPLRRGAGVVPPRHGCGGRHGAALGGARDHVVEVGPSG